MTRLRASARIVQVLVVLVWLASYVDTDSLGLAGTVAGSCLLMVGSTELALRIVQRL